MIGGNIHQFRTRLLDFLLEAAENMVHYELPDWSAASIFAEPT